MSTTESLSMNILDPLISFCGSLLDAVFAAFFLKTVTFSSSGVTVYINDKKESIGEGAFSTVLKGIRPFHEPKVYAVKKMLAQSQELADIAAVEIKSYGMFKHKHILELLDYLKVEEGGMSVIYLLFPYFERGSLRDNLTSILAETIPKPSVVSVLQNFLNICKAINVLHSYKPSAFVHQDIKPENILIGADNTPYLIDFGSVRTADVPINSRRDAMRVMDEASIYCTASYRSPELFDPPRNTVLDARTDTWAMGCLLFAWWFGYSPFECEFYGTTLKVVECSSLRVLSSIPKSSHPSKDDLVVLDIVEWILEKNFQVRPYTEDIIEKLQSTLIAHQGGQFQGNSDNVV